MGEKPTGASAPSVGVGESSRWAEVYDELRSHQSLASVTNDPRGRGLFASKWESIGDIGQSLWETVEELNDLREGEEKGADLALVTRIDALLGPVPDVFEFQSYLDTFTEIWDVYHRSHKAKNSKLSHVDQKDSVDDDTAIEAHQTVPHEYFRSDFKLEHHQIFRQSLQASIERQDEFNTELTGHLDNIEVSLFEHIRRAQRDQLFDSLAKLSEPLQADLRGTTAVLGSLRGQLRSVQRHQLKCGMVVGQLARRKQREDEVLQRLDCLAHVQQSLPSIQMLLTGQDYVTALDLLESTTSALESNLKGIASIKPGSQRLKALGNTFDRVVEADFVHHSMEAVLNTSESSDGAASAEPLRGTERLKRLCWCLSRRELLKTALSSTLRDVLLSQFKKVLKVQARTLLEEQTQANNLAADDPDEETAGGGAAANSGSNTAEGGNSAESSKQTDTLATSGMTAALRALTFEKFLAFWERLLLNCVDIAARFSEYAVLIHTTAQGLTARDGVANTSSGMGGKSSKDEVDVSGELLRLFEVIMNSLLQKTGVLLQARQGEHQAVDVYDWQNLLKISYGSLDKVKAWQDQCKRMMNPKSTYVGVDVRAGVRAILYTQTKQIIEDISQKKLAQMTLVLEQERWERTDVPMEYKAILEQVIGKQHEPEIETGTPEQGVERYLHVEGLPFIVVPAVLTLVQLLKGYVQLCRDFESLAAEIVQRIGNLLRLFNTTTHRLVLRGEAVQKQTLKKITASNLALCSQCCGLVAQILPNLQSNLLSILREQQQSSANPAGRVVATLVSDLSKISTEYTDHRTALFGKLSDLLRERYEFHAKKWLSTAHPAMKDSAPWIHEVDVTPQEIDLCPHEALEGLVKDIISMYRVLLKNLTGDSVRRIFAKAFEEISGKFELRVSQELVASTPPYEDRVGRSLGDRLALDVAFLQEQLEKLSGISTPLQRLLFEMLQHLQAKLPADQPVKALHTAALEVLQRVGKVPQ